MMRMIRLMLSVVLLSIWLLSTPPIDCAQNDDLQRAAEDGNADLVRASLNNGTDINARDTAGKTALMYAASKDHVEILEILLKNGAAVDAVTTNATPKWLNGWTALMYATNRNNCTAARVLLDAGANPSKTADDGATVLTQATGCRDDIVRALQRRDATFAKGSTGGMALVSAALTGDAAAVNTLLDKGADVNTKTNDGGTPLMVAAVMGHTDVMRLLLERGADVNARNNTGDTALLLTIENASDADTIRALVAVMAANKGALGGAPQPTLGIVRVLLDNRADVNATTAEGATALMYATQRCDEGIVQMLLDKGANVKLKTNAGVTALMIAQNGRCGNIVKKLRNAGAK